MGRRILIAEFDLFHAVGGGQTVYQSIIRGCLDDEFFYFAQKETPETPRPPNTQIIPFRPFYTNLIRQASRSGHLLWMFRDAMDMAKSVQLALGETYFDIVDTPDYRSTGLFLRHALEAHGQKVGKVALALHGTLSSAFRGGWPWKGDASRMLAELVLRERLMFRVADIRYAISESYAAEMQRRSNHPVAILDPLLILGDAKPVLSPPSTEPPQLLFIGRREKRKGPDLFVDLAWWLPASVKPKTMLIGSDGQNHEGQGGDGLLEQMARNRGLNIEFAPNASPAALRRMRQAKSIVAVLSRYDQFNLVALEALLDGCPTIVSRGAGAAAFIEKHLPALKWLIVDISCDRPGGEVLTDLIENYDQRRAEIVAAIEKANLRPDQTSLATLYDGENHFDEKVAASLADLADHFTLFNVRDPRRAYSTMDPVGGFTFPFGIRARAMLRKIPVRRALKGTLGPFVRLAFNTARGAWKTCRDFARSVRHPHHELRKLVIQQIVSSLRLEGQLLSEASRIASIPSVRANLQDWSQRTPTDRRNMLGYLTSLVSERRLDRVRYFREMIRHERALGNDLVAAAYGLRIIRWMGGDQFGLTHQIKSALTKEGYHREAEAVEAMFGSQVGSENASRAFLDDQLARHRNKPKLSLEIFDDRRGDRPVRATIIVSLYRAASKMPAFVSMLRQQTMVRDGGCDVVFVDSGSPDREYAVFKEIMATAPVPALYVRSAERETIQAAWNRGIQLARGEYLAFLGVDEGIHPECMSVLAETLDKDHSVDWAMADSVVTELDRNAIFSHDIMKYDRRGYRQDWHYLDTTFLSYVGGLYRKNIHERVGYYDETFRAAGDTEFKNRVLPFIKSRYVPRTLGVFNNYMEERTTQHPRAEIEDLRAWYMHRTVAGVSYAFDQRSESDIRALLNDTLSYRKCYCQHISTDLDLANSLATYIARRTGQARDTRRAQAVSGMLNYYRRFELLTNRLNIQELGQDFALTWRRIDSAAPLHQKLFELPHPPAYRVFNDNRYEQHWWSWSVYS